MKRWKSQKTGKEFWVDAERTDPFEGLPCFSHAEISLLKQENLKDEALDRIYEGKRNEGATVAALLLGLSDREKPEPFIPPPSAATYRELRSDATAKSYLQKIREEIALKNPRTEVKVPRIPKTKEPEK